jgi:hypothetical protein
VQESILVFGRKLSCFVGTGALGVEGSVTVSET